MGPCFTIMPVVNLRAKTDKREEVKISRSSVRRTLLAVGMRSPKTGRSSPHRRRGRGMGPVFPYSIKKTVELFFYLLQSILFFPIFIHLYHNFITAVGPRILYQFFT
jgi:hypothetical protein